MYTLLAIVFVPGYPGNAVPLSPRINKVAANGVLERFKFNQIRQ